jgi:hypothetical protein
MPVPFRLGKLLVPRANGGRHPSLEAYEAMAATLPIAILS